MEKLPTTLDEAVDWCRDTLSIEELRIVKTTENSISKLGQLNMSDTAAYMRDKLGLWGTTSAIMKNEGWDHADTASEAILYKLREVLLTADQEESSEDNEELGWGAGLLALAGAAFVAALSKKSTEKTASVAEIKEEDVEIQNRAKSA